MRTYSKLRGGDEPVHPDALPALVLTLVLAATLRTPAQLLKAEDLSAFHRSGQTFLTWTEVGSVAGESYRIYRHTDPIGASNLTAAARLATIRGNSSWHAREGARFIIAPLGAPLAENQGLFVHTVDDAGASYYAVTVVTGGVENAADFDAGNSLAAPVAEQPALPEPVLIRTNGRSRVFTQFMDYARWNPTFNGYAYNYAVNLSSDVATNAPAPLFLLLHPYGNRYEVHASPSLGVKGIEVCVDDPGNTWHYGYSATWNYEAGGTPTTGPIVNFTELRHVRAVLDVVRSPLYNVDTNRIYVYGSSMGGSGALSMGLRYPALFAAAFCWLPMTDYRAAANGNWSWDLIPKWGAVASNLPIENRGPLATQLAVFDGAGVYDWMDHSAWISAHPAQESAYIFFHHGTSDTTIAWPSQGQALPLAMYRGRRGFHAMIDGAGHVGLGWNDPVDNATANWHFKLSDLRRDRSFPAFGWASDNPPLPPAAVSRFNFALEWSCPWNNFDGDVSDEPASYSIALRSTGVAQRVVVTPRRLQAFAPGPGRRVLWRNVPAGGGPATEAGTVFADAHGLVSVTNFLVTPAGNRLLLDADDPTDSDGDGAPDYWEIAHGFAPGDAADGVADADGDGVPNAAEFVHGTNPSDAGSVFRIVAYDGESVAWQSVAGFAYRVAAGPSPGVWSTTAPPVIADGPLTVRPSGAVTGNVLFVAVQIGAPEPP